MRNLRVIAVATVLSMPVALAWIMTGPMLLRPAYQSSDPGFARVEPATVAIGPLQRGASFRMDPPRSPTPYAALHLLVATWETMPFARWSVCADGHCARTFSWV